MYRLGSRTEKLREKGGRANLCCWVDPPWSNPSLCRSSYCPFSTSSGCVFGQTWRCTWTFGGHPWRYCRGEAYRLTAVPSNKWCTYTEIDSYQELLDTMLPSTGVQGIVVAFNRKLAMSAMSSCMPRTSNPKRAMIRDLLGGGVVWHVRKHKYMPFRYKNKTHSDCHQNKRGDIYVGRTSEYFGQECNTAVHWICGF